MLAFTEAGTTRRASMHVVRGEEALRAFDRGGLEVLEASLPAFAERLALENHTLKRALTDPRLFSGIGNAYSDEILHRARLSPLARTAQLRAEEVERLYHATRDTLLDWIARLRAETGDAFPEKVTAFREGMAVHGRYRLPCPDCGTPVQRIRYAANETNYCARCQTDGRLLADRALSRLLKQDWPRTIDELEGGDAGSYVGPCILVRYTGRQPRNDTSRLSLLAGGPMRAPGRTASRRTSGAAPDVALLVQSLRENYGGGAWHGPAVRTALRGVDAWTRWANRIQRATHRKGVARCPREATADPLSR